MENTQSTEATQHPESSWSHLLWIFLLGFGVYLAYFPVLTGLFRAWSTSEDYSHGFAIFPLCAYLLWRRRRELQEIPIQSSWTGLVLFSVGMAAYLFARLAEISTLASLSLIPSVGGIILFIYGKGIARICLFPLGLLVFMIPVPSQIYARLTIPLQFIVTKATAAIASFAGVPLLREGNVIHLPEQTFEVVQACSGMRSLMTMLLLGTVFGYLFFRKKLSRILLVSLSVPIAVSVNIVRVLAMVVFAYYWNIDLVNGPLHEVFGLAVFALALGMFFAAKGVIERWEA